MSQKIAIAAIAAVIILVGAYALYANSRPALNTEPVREEFTWTFEDRGVERTSGAPTTNVSLNISGVEIPLGIYVGNCFSVAGSAWQLLPNELSGAICYFAGGGKEIGVFEEAGKLVLKEGEIDEGDAETPGTRGNFVPIVRQP